MSADLRLAPGYERLARIACYYTVLDGDGDFGQEIAVLHRELRDLFPALSQTPPHWRKLEATHPARERTIEFARRWHLPEGDSELYGHGGGCERVFDSWRVALETGSWFGLRAGLAQVWLVPGVITPAAGAPFQWNPADPNATRLLKEAKRRAIAELSASIDTQADAMRKAAEDHGWARRLSRQTLEAWRLSATDFLTHMHPVHGATINNMARRALADDSFLARELSDDPGRVGITTRVNQFRQSARPL